MERWTGVHSSVSRRRQYAEQWKGEDWRRTEHRVRVAPVPGRGVLEPKHVGCRSEGREEGRTCASRERRREEEEVEPEEDLSGWLASAWLRSRLYGERAHRWKPVQADVEPEGDTERLLPLAQRGVEQCRVDDR